MVLKAQQEHKGQKVQQEHKEHKVQQEVKELQGHKEQPVEKVTQVHKVL